MSSLPTNNLGDLCDSDNYHGIALTSCLNKVIDWVILFKYRDQLHTSHMQFAYKENHSTSMCTMALKEVVNCYSLRRGQVYCCLLDASKAFDRVRFDNSSKCFCKETYLPVSSVYYLIYRVGKDCTVWEGCFSQQFPSANGVRQSGVLLPILFIIYVDTLLSKLESSGFGCFVGDEYFGSMCYSDDITLLAPTFASLKSMIKIWEQFGKEFDLTFIANKTVCIYFPGKRRYRENPPILYMNDKALSRVKGAKHLGIIVTWDLREVEEFQRNDAILLAGQIVC